MYHDGQRLICYEMRPFCVNLEESSELLIFLNVRKNMLASRGAKENVCSC